MTTAQSYKRHTFRSSKAEWREYLSVEKQLFKVEWKWLLAGALMQYVHGVCTNIAYWIQKDLSVEQRFPLYDLGYELMPPLSEANALSSEILVFGGIFAPTFFLLGTVALFRQNPDKPRYLVLIFKRVLLALSLAQILRVLSFLGTSLPGAAPHCAPVFDQECLKSQDRSEPAANCVVPNPEFIPPKDFGEVFTRMDLFTGCGDLQFSSHTIFTLTFLLAMLKYWYNKYLLMYVVSVQTALAFLIIAARKHYTLDVFTAIYVVPMIWFLLEAYHRDCNSREIGTSVETIQEYYNVDVQRDLFYCSDRCIDPVTPGSNGTATTTYNQVGSNGRSEDGATAAVKELDNAV